MITDEENVNRKVHQPPQEFVNGILIQEYLKLHPLTADQIEKNRRGLIKEFIHA